MHVEGYNLGASVDDIVLFSVRGVECLTMRRESSNSVSCVFGNEIVTSDLGAVRGVFGLVSAFMWGLTIRATPYETVCVRCRWKFSGFRIFDRRAFLNKLQ